MVGLGCDIKWSMQHIEQIAQPVFDILASFWVFHLSVLRQRSPEPTERGSEKT